MTYQAFHRTLVLTITSLTTLGLLVGCATTGPPGELTMARSEFKNASKPQVQHYAPDEFGEAALAIEDAEKAYKEDGDVARTRTLSHVALRKSQRARVAASRFELNRTHSNDSMALLESYETYTKAFEGQVVVFPDAAVLSVYGNVFFEFDKATLTPFTILMLNDVVAALRHEPDKVVTIIGHTDSRGTNTYNQQLSVDRAKATRASLVDSGIDPDRVSLRAMGEDQPVASNTSAEGRANNRRVEIIISNRPFALRIEN